MTTLILINAYGGGIGQAEAIRLVLSRAMCELDAETVHPKPEGILTRDPRMVERKNWSEESIVRNSTSVVNISPLTRTWPLYYYIEHLLKMITI
jgi:ribosomal protein S9